MRTEDISPKRILLAHALCVLVGGLCVSTAAQSSFPYDYRQIPSPAGLGWFAKDMIVLDVNHDGFNDLIAIDGAASVNGVPGAGKAFVMFGPTLTHVLEISPANPSPGEQLGFMGGAYSVGDVNGDGEYDLLLGGPKYDARSGTITDAGRAQLFLGPDFAKIIIFDDPSPEVQGWFGHGVLLADLDGDGLDDVTIGAPQKSRVVGQTQIPQAGQVFTWRAPEWASPPTEILQPHPGAIGHFGKYLADLDPVDRDSGRDLLVNATNYPPPGFGAGTGVSFWFDGSTLEFFEVVLPPSVQLSQYAEFGPRADIDGDGVDDWMMIHFGGIFDAAVVSGADLESSILEFSEPLPTYGVSYGEQGAFSDLDRDGFVDILLSEVDYSFFTGAVHIYWGPDFQKTELVSSDFFGGNLGGFGAGLQTGDLDGDGFDEILAQSPGFGFPNLWVLRRRSLVADTTELSVASGAAISLSIDLPDERAGHTYLAALSLSDPGEGLILAPGSYIPLTPDSLTKVGFSLLETPFLDGFLGILDASGDATFSLNWPAGAGGGLAGQTIHIAAVTAAPDGTFGAGTNELTITVVP